MTAHSNENRRQRYRQYEEECINNDDYSLDASKSSNRGKRTVDSKDNSCREGSKVPNTVVDLTTHPEQSITGNESILN